MKMVHCKQLKEEQHVIFYNLIYTQQQYRYKLLYNMSLGYLNGFNPIEQNYNRRNKRLIP